MIRTIGVWTIRIILVLAAVIAGFTGKEFVGTLTIIAILSFVLLDGGDEE